MAITNRDRVGKALRFGKYGFEDAYANRLLRVDDPKGVTIDRLAVSGIARSGRFGTCAGGCLAGR